MRFNRLDSPHRTQLHFRFRELLRTIGHEPFDLRHHDVAMQVDSVRA